MFGLMYEMDPGIVNQVYQIVEGKATKVREYNKDETTTFRPLRPDDPVLQGTVFAYTSSMASGTAARLLGASSDATIETGMGVVQLGWYCNANLGNASYFYTNVNSIKRNEAPGKPIYEQNVPPHLMLTPTMTVFGKQNERIAFYYYQNTGATIAGIALPYGFYIGPAKQLLVE